MEVSRHDESRVEKCKLPTGSADGPRVFLVGLYEGGHPGGARYPAFNNHLGATFVGSPMKFRYFSRGWKTWLDWGISKLTPRPHYSVGLFVQEVAVGLHMLRHRGSVYHSVKGEVDVLLLPLISRLTGTYMLATYHDHPEGLMYWRIGKLVTKYIAGVILVSESQRSYFDRLLPPDRVFVVPHGVDTALFHPAERPSDEPIAIAVGAYGRDYQTLVNAMPLVWAVNPGVRFILVGTRQAETKNPAPRVDDPRVEYIDGISDERLVQMYHDSGVAIISVDNATANNGLLEAMACGLPVVATNVGGIREYLGDEAGLLIPKRDPQALANGVLGVLEDRPAAQRMGAAGRARVLNYDYGVVTEQLRDAYSRATALG
jgi:glycosyltransferase involved in cell wall biosynthesis